MKKYFLLFFSVLFVMSCTDEIPEEKLPLRSGRTVLAYLVSNNKGGADLDSELKQNLVDMYEGLSYVKDTCTLVVYYRPNESDNDGLQGPSILKFTTDGTGYINKKPALTGKELTAANVIKCSSQTSYSEEKKHNATDPKNMGRILEKMKELSPSESYGLIFGSHGTGWLKGTSVDGRAFGDDNGYNINIPEMADVLETVFTTPLDFVIFDACMMATVEVSYEFRNATNFLVGSVVETHVYGLPYDVILPKLYEEKVRYAEICQDYTKFSKSHGAWGVCAVIDCNEIDALADWMNDSLSNYSDAFVKLDLSNVQQYGVGLFRNFSYDVVDLFKALNNGVLPTELELIMSKVVVAKDALYGNSYKVVGDLLIEAGHYCGVGMYLPNNDDINRPDWDRYYSESISWYKAAGWDGFVYGDDDANDDSSDDSGDNADNETDK